MNIFEMLKLFMKSLINLYGIRLSSSTTQTFSNSILNFDDNEKFTNFDLTFDFWLTALEKVIYCFLPLKFKYLATFWTKRVESHPESNNAFTVTELFPFDILSGRTCRKTCKFRCNFNFIDD